MPKFSVKKPLTVFVAVLAILVLGVVAYLKMTPDLMPNMDFPYVILVTTERTILRNLAARYPHKTCIVTTHRPTVISLCRRVYQVSGGRMELLDNDRAQRLAMDF